MCVVLDAGHGGIDGGVVGRETGVKESDVNLAVTMQLKTVLENAGFDVTLTRKTESGLYGAATKGFKKRDMQKRKEIIEEAKPVAMISIHQNFYPTRTSRGGQVFYRDDVEKGENGSNSLALAECIQSRLNLLYAAEGAKERKAATGDYYMLKCTSYTSVIVECGFLSNAADEKLLLSETHRQKLAEAIYAGFAEYLAQVSGT
jgi:N-acetylmuramoyl-L-alanine amidase